MLQNKQVQEKIESIEKRLISIIAVILILVPIIAGLLYILIFSVNIPYLDQWVDEIPHSIKIHSGDTTLLEKALHSQNDVRPIIKNILLPILYDITNFNLLIAILLNYFIYIASFFIFSALIIKKFGFCTKTSLLLIPLSFFYFHIYIIFPLLWGGVGIYYALMPFFVILTFYVLERSTHFDLWFCIAIFSAICCFFSFSSGVFIWVGVLTYLALKNGANKKSKIIATCASAGLIIFLNYFVFQPPIIGTSTISGFELISQWISQPIRLMTHFTSALGSNVIHHLDFSIFTGGIILLLLFSVIWTNKFSLDLNETAVWYSLIIYGITIIAALVILRGYFESFYTLPTFNHISSTIFVLPGLLALTYYYFSRADTTQTERTNNNRDVQLILLAGISCLMILSAPFHFFPGIDFGYAWYSEQTNLANFYQDFTNDEIDKTITTFGGIFLSRLLYEEPEEDFIGKGLDRLVINNMPLAMKYFEANQLNLYDPAQNLHFKGIWGEIRDAMFHLFPSRWPSELVSLRYGKVLNYPKEM